MSMPTEDGEELSSLSGVLTGRNLRPSLSLRTSMSIWFPRLPPMYLLHSWLRVPKASASSARVSSAHGATLSASDASLLVSTGPLSCLLSLSRPFVMSLHLVD